MKPQHIVAEVAATLSVALVFAACGETAEPDPVEPDAVEPVGVWEPMPAAPGSFTPRISPAFAAAGDDVLIWGGIAVYCGHEAEAATASEAPLDVTCTDGLTFSLSENSWREVASVDQPTSRFYPDRRGAVVLEDQFAVFGGACNGLSPCTNGGLYDPTLDSWTLIELPEWHTPTTQPFVGKAAGSLLLWGGFRPEGRGRRTVFDHGALLVPKTLAWTAMSSAGAPPSDARLVNVGEQVLAFDERTRIFDGASWTERSAVPEDCCSYFVPAGDNIMGVTLREGRMSGDQGPPYEALWFYEIASDTWRSLSLPNLSPAPPSVQTVFFDERFVAWGGVACPGVVDPTGHGSPPCLGSGSYHLTSDTWAPIQAGSGLIVRGSAVNLPTSRGLLVWGGEIPGIIATPLSDGAFLRFEE